jgi:hypothetical protein
MKPLAGKSISIFSFPGAKYLAGIVRFGVSIVLQACMVSQTALAGP